MNAKEYRDAHPVFYVFFIIGNIFTLGWFWFVSTLIGYGIAKGNEKK